VSQHSELRTQKGPGERPTDGPGHVAGHGRRRRRPSLSPPSQPQFEAEFPDLPKGCLRTPELRGGRGSELCPGRNQPRGRPACRGALLSLLLPEFSLGGQGGKQTPKSHGDSLARPPRIVWAGLWKKRKIQNPRQTTLRPRQRAGDSVGGGDGSRPSRGGTRAALPHVVPPSGGGSSGERIVETSLT